MLYLCTQVVILVSTLMIMLYFPASILLKSFKHRIALHERTISISYHSKTSYNTTQKEKTSSAELFQANKNVRPNYINVTHPGKMLVTVGCIGRMGNNMCQYGSLVHLGLMDSQVQVIYQQTISSIYKDYTTTLTEKRSCRLNMQVLALSENYI